MLSKVTWATKFRRNRPYSILHKMNITYQIQVYNMAGQPKWLALLTVLVRVLVRTLNRRMQDLNCNTILKTFQMQTNW